MKSVVVYNLASMDQEIVFEDLTPEQAVIAAYEESIGNHDASNYRDPEDHFNFSEGSLNVSCGDFSAPKILSKQGAISGWQQLKNNYLEFVNREH